MLIYFQEDFFLKAEGVLPEIRIQLRVRNLPWLRFPCRMKLQRLQPKSFILHLFQLHSIRCDQRWYWSYLRIVIRHLIMTIICSVRRLFRSLFISSCCSSYCSSWD